MLGVVTVVAIVGLGMVLVDRRRPARLRAPTADRRKNDERQTTNDERQNTRHSLVLGLTFLLTLALHIFYNLTFVQHQGRYLFPALIPMAVGFVAGWGYWLRPVVRRWPWTAWLLPPGIAALLGGISLYALWRILPGLAPG